MTLITNIQRYSIHDGAGIRTTVFFKGCPLRCGWCHNPETQGCAAQSAFYAERCGGCPDCAFEAGRECPNGAREILGKHYNAEELVKLLLRDEQFYTSSEGGVTLSGGEPMAQDMDYIISVAEKLSRNRIDIAIDTCGDVIWSRFEAVLPYVNAFLYDYKLLDRDAHILHTGADNARILENLARLIQAGAGVHIRIPVIGGVNCGEEAAGMIEYAALNFKGARSVHLLPYHNTGSGKYERIGMSWNGSGYFTPSRDEMEALAEKWRKAGFNSVIGG